MVIFTQVLIRGHLQHFPELFEYVRRILPFDNYDSSHLYWDENAGIEYRRYVAPKSKGTVFDIPPTLHPVFIDLMVETVYAPGESPLDGWSFAWFL